MLKKPTVLILGAGAGVEINMPLGEGLSSKIATSVDIWYEHGYVKKSGNDFVIEALKKLAKKTDTDFNQYREKGVVISKAVKLSRSIDNYVNAYRHDPMIQEVAKIAIVQTILDAERESYVHVDEGKHPFVFRSEGSVNKSWMNDLFYLLHIGRFADELDGFFDNLTIINFNYDRCIEQFFFYILKQFYHEKTREYIGDLITKKLKVIHPYGYLGRLSWQGPAGSVPFGAHPSQVDLHTLSQGIKTYTERVDDDAILQDIGQVLGEAHQIIILGFHYHLQNMELLGSRKGFAKKNTGVFVFSTQVNRSPADIAVIEGYLSALLDGRRTSTASSFKDECDCKTLFKNFGVLFGS